MHMSGQSLLVIVLVGIVAGWLAGQIVRGTGFGIIGDLIIGIIGAFIGDWLLPQLGIHLGVGIVAAIINATIGAVVLLFIVTLVRGGGRFGGGRSWGRRGRPQESRCPKGKMCWGLRFMFNSRTADSSESSNIHRIRQAIRRPKPGGTPLEC
jgi:uncharacterized membrane protein YeaQ/YmgE (transglycosylase-associated protein family)